MNDVCVNVPGGLFYDLGSGTGKVSLAAALLHSFSESYGVELLPDLHERAVALKDRYMAYASRWNGRDALPMLQYIQGSFLCKDDCDWTRGDVVFVNSHCLTDDIMMQLSLLAGGHC